MVQTRNFNTGIQTPSTLKTLISNSMFLTAHQLMGKLNSLAELFRKNTLVDEAFLLRTNAAKLLANVVDLSDEPSDQLVLETQERMQELRGFIAAQAKLNRISNSKSIEVEAMFTKLTNGLFEQNKSKYQLTLF